MLKVHGRCDLSCDHCYVYEHADQSWSAKPARVGADVVARAADRIAEHAGAHGQRGVVLILHGGEPLLLGVDGMRAVLDALRARLDPVVGLDLRVHTNGMRLDERFCALFTEYGVKVGVSLDGDRAANDRHRRYRDGRSSHAGVLRAVALLRERRHLYAGILCTIDLGNDPIAVYEALLAEDPPMVELLLPHATWEVPPLRPAGVPAPYAAWLGEIYRRWNADGRPVPIRLFDSVLSAARGGASWTEAVGLEPVDLLVIDTDGQWEQADSLKVAFDGAPSTGMTVFSHSVDEAAAHPGVAARSNGRDDLCAQCRSCEVVGICGGGLYAHRYRAGSGFDNPSVYCADLKALIRQIVPAPPRSGASPDEAVHRVPAAALDSLGRGPGDDAALALLAASQLSITRALVAEVAAAQRARGRGRDDRELARVAAAGWALLCELDESHPGAVQKVMSHPFVRTWAVRRLRPAAGARTSLDQAHLAGLAAAAAIRAGISAELRLPVRDGRLHLPALGAIDVGGSAGCALVRISPDAVTCEHGGVRQTVRTVRAGGLRFPVDDLDPFRDAGEWVPSGRLSGPDWHAWRGTFAAAMRVLRAQLPDYLQGLAAGVRVVVPLARPVREATAQDTYGAAQDAYGAAQDAYGAVAVGPHPDPLVLGERVVGAFQRAKSQALSELLELCGNGEVLRVPWCAEPQRADDVLHDAYVRLALAELWRARGSPRRARDERDGLARRVDALLGSGALTPDGERFVRQMATAVD
ncbi:FxsB family cyclophane-forming radical SAM/SPASM peptide maturase [Actinomadura fulvescens]|uniref:FxsB family cyclophane-forming radical SAM/SPASM peptide maturase n=1 Tax=Actinomadura fulvescens TaxID=46160 RepID=UPI0031E47838